jgi:hypothetical protein
VFPPLVFVDGDGETNSPTLVTTPSAGDMISLVVWHTTRTGSDVTTPSVASMQSIPP